LQQVCFINHRNRKRRKGGIVVTITTGKLDNLTTFIVAIAYRRAITSKKRNFEVETESVSEVDNLIFVLLKSGLDVFFMARVTKICKTWTGILQRETAPKLCVT